jgi:hypothetical protein
MITETLANQQNNQIEAAAPAIFAEIAAFGGPLAAPPLHPPYFGASDLADLKSVFSQYDCEAGTSKCSCGNAGCFCGIANIKMDSGELTYFANKLVEYVTIDGGPSLTHQSILNKIGSSLFHRGSHEST